MAVKINLLPQDYKVSDSVVKVIKIVRPLNVILLTIFLVTALGLAGYFIYSSVTIRDLNAGNKTLISQIQSLQVAQKQVVLLKDRLGKIKRVMSKPNADNSLIPVQALLSNLSDTSSVTELTIDSEKTSVGINFKSNSELTSFLNRIGNEPVFLNVSMDSFNYIPTEGYVVNFSFTINKST